MYQSKSEIFSVNLNSIKSEIIRQIVIALRYLGKERISLRYYHDEDTITPYTFFEVDGDGYGRELFIDTIVYDKNENINVLLHDTEDCYQSVWEINDMIVTDCQFLLEELEMLCEFKDKNPDEEIVSDYEGEE